MLKFKPFTVASEWKFEDPDTGHKYYADSREELIRKILSYRGQNNLEDIFQLGAVLDNYLCTFPENVGKCVRNDKIERSWWQTLRGGVALLVNMRYQKFVDREEANRRAQICIGCPHNVFPNKGAFVKRQDQIAEAATGGKRCTDYEKLGSCEICSCPLRCKVWFGGNITLSKEEKKKLPEYCWQTDGKRG